ncbi:TlpA family protein disulfide reductase [Chryseobacterium binzhouense]|uniref:TlpA family protein disulfide reductase n=1 Tax=Chryseobacterium binzhouense TaxID=2593646 RepID=UPI00117D74DA|nr:TlpA disulfide reductase family protein [Chryseobacterium binzhouense]
MKKKVLIIISVVILVVFVVYNFGFQIGNVTVGKQQDTIERNSKFNIENSSFSKEFLASDSISVINLWASWCEPCLKEMPVFKKLEKNNPTVKFATLSIDKDEKELIDAIKNYNLTNDITLDNSEYRKAIRNFLENRDLNSLIRNEIVPVTYIIKEGKVIHKLTGSIDYDEVNIKINSLK